MRGAAPGIANRDGDMPNRDFGRLPALSIT
jgi:hypothetical protein